MATRVRCARGAHISRVPLRHPAKLRTLVQAPSCGPSQREIFPLYVVVGAGPPAACSSFRQLVAISRQNEVYKYPDLWICLYKTYGCDTWELEAECVNSAWETEGGAPYAAFYPKEKLEDPWPDATHELRIDASPELTDVDSEGNEKNVSEPRRPPLLLARLSSSLPESHRVHCV